MSAESQAFQHCPGDSEIRKKVDWGSNVDGLSLCTTTPLLLDDQRRKEDRNLHFLELLKGTLWKACIGWLIKRENEREKSEQN